TRSGRREIRDSRADQGALGSDEILRVGTVGVERSVRQRARRRDARERRRVRGGHRGRRGLAAPPGRDGAPWARACFLSARYEAVAHRRPRFFATGGTRPFRIAVSVGKEVVWRSAALEGSGPWPPEGFPDLDAWEVSLWRAGSEDGTPQSEWVPFRVSSTADADAAAAFEKEMAAL